MTSCIYMIVHHWTERYRKTFKVWSDRSHFHISWCVDTVNQNAALLHWIFIVLLHEWQKHRRPCGGNMRILQRIVWEKTLILPKLIHYSPNLFLVCVCGLICLLLIFLCYRNRYLTMGFLRPMFCICIFWINFMCMYCLHIFLSHPTQQF